MKRTVTILVVLAIALCAQSCADRAQRTVFTGTLEADEIELIAVYTAELRELRVQEGQPVSAGDTLAILDTTVAASGYRAALAAVDQARAQLADLEAGSDKEKIRAAEARLSAASATLEQLKRDLERAETLHSQQLIDDKTLELSRLAEENATAEVSIASEQLADLRRGARIDQIAAARSALQRAEAELAAREKALSDAFLVAPGRGIVELLPYQLGERIPAGRAALTLRNPDSLWALIYLPENMLTAADVGDSLTFSVDAAPGKTFHATVSYLSPTAEFTPRNVQSPEERLNLVFAVKVTVAPGQTGLRPGMPADFTLAAAPTD